MQGMTLIYKLLRSAEWTSFQETALFSGSAVDREDGFIHFSTGSQVAETARRHFSMFDDVWLIAVESESLGPGLKWEPSRGGDLFPHYYGSLPLSAVRESEKLEKGDQGDFLFREDL